MKLILIGLLSISSAFSSTTICSNDHFELKINQVSETGLALEYQVDLNKKPNYFDFIEQRLRIDTSGVEVSGGRVVKLDNEIDVNDINFLFRFYPENLSEFKGTDGESLPVTFNNIPVMHVSLNTTEKEVNFKLNYYKNYTISENFKLNECSVEHN